MQQWSNLAAAPGLAQGRALRLPHIGPSPKRIAAHALPAELERLHQAEQHLLQRWQQQLQMQVPGSPAAAVLEVQLLLLQDPERQAVVQAAIEHDLHSASAALAHAEAQQVAQFAAIDDAYLQERQADIRQLYAALQQALLSDATSPWQQALAAAQVHLQQHPNDALILLAHDVLPSDFLQWADSPFAGLVCGTGSNTSHLALLARSLGVPALFGAAEALTQIQGGDWLLLDGTTGHLQHQPTAAERQAFTVRMQASAETAPTTSPPSPCHYRGEAVQLLANIEWPAQAASALAAGAEGIGLFRSEFLFFSQPDLPSTEQQYLAYRQALEAMAGHPVTIRTLDIGADKPLPSLATQPAAANPALGWRGLRWCLRQPAIFRAQLLALLQAAPFGHLRVMLPMVTQLSEWRSFQHLWRSCQETLRSAGTPYAVPPVGVMIETPAAAWQAEDWLQCADFLSIGSNDLAQYTLAADRTQADLAAQFPADHPAVMGLIAHTVAAGQRCGKPVSLCGDLAASSAHTAALLALGLRQLSMPVPQLPAVRQAVSNASHIA